MREGHNAEGRDYRRVEAPDVKKRVVFLDRSHQHVGDAAGSDELRAKQERKGPDRRVGVGPVLVRTVCVSPRGTFRDTVIESLHIPHSQHVRAGRNTRDIVPSC